MSVCSGPPRLLALVLPLLATDRLRRKVRRAGAPAEEAPLVIAGKRDNALVLTAVDAAAAALGLTPGLPLATARAMVARLKVAEADPAADAALMDDIADWAERYTPFVGLAPPQALVLDIAGSAHLFGGEHAMMADALARLARAGLACRAAVAGTRATALALARFAPQRAALVPVGSEAEAVAGLGVAALGLKEAATAGLARLGLKRIGDLAACPRETLAARFGADLLERLDAVRGLRADPLSPRRLAPAAIAERRFAEPIGHEEDVRRSILALAHELAALLERGGEGARRLELTFFRADGMVRRLAVDTGRPLRDPAAMARLYRERLDALADPLDPGFGFDVMRLSALATQPLLPLQRALGHGAKKGIPAFHEEPGEARKPGPGCDWPFAQRGLGGESEEGEALADLVDRLCARFGGRRVTGLVAQDTHMPERAGLAVPLQHRRETYGWSTWLAEGEPPARPIRLLDPPERIEAVAEIPDGPPLRFRWRRVLHAVCRAEGPERIAAEWWRAGADALTRDYFRVEDAHGRRFWLFREGLWNRETPQPRWFVHGLFA